MNPKGAETVLQTYRNGNEDPELPILEWEVRAANSRMPNNKTPGTDNILGELLKATAEEITQVMQQYIIYRKMARTVE